MFYGGQVAMVYVELEEFRDIEEKMAGNWGFFAMPSIEGDPRQPEVPNRGSGRVHGLRQDEASRPGRRLPELPDEQGELRQDGPGHGVAQPRHRRPSDSWSVSPPDRTDT